MKHTLYIDDQLKQDLFPRKFSAAGQWWVTTLLLVILVGLVAYARQLTIGLEVTAMRDYVSWGMYISNFVFLVAVSLVGSLITAVLYLLDVKWRTPLTRISEIIAVSAILFAAIIIVVDMGRPDRMFNLFIYGRIQSPIIWDVIVVNTYLVISLLLLYFPLLPDIALCRDNLQNIPSWQKRMYTMLAMGWNNHSKQYKIVHKAVRILTILIVPVALSIHTVTSWLFATTFRPGWDSTNFGAYFVSGAFQVGAAAVIAAMFIILLSNPNLKKYITEKHFDLMGKLLVLLSLVYLYFNINEYFVPAYKMKHAEAEHIYELFAGHYAPMFWFVMIFGVTIPVVVLLSPKGRKPTPLFVMALLVIAGAWLKRFLIVIPTMLHPFLPIQQVPEEWMHYNPTWEEWSITLASLAGVMLLITLFTRYFPIVPIWETAEEKQNSAVKEEIPSVKPIVVEPLIKSHAIKS
jgi:Ni/Fe-hydrogenase subunit HybB-like protein